VRREAAEDNAGRVSMTKAERGAWETLIKLMVNLVSQANNYSAENAQLVGGLVTYIDILLKEKAGA